MEDKTPDKNNQKKGPAGPPPIPSVSEKITTTPTEVATTPPTLPPPIPSIPAQQESLETSAIETVDVVKTEDNVTAENSDNTPAPMPNLPEATVIDESATSLPEPENEAIPTATTQPAAPTVAPKKKSNRKMFLIIGLIVGFLILVGGGIAGLLIYKFHDKVIPQEKKTRTSRAYAEDMIEEESAVETIDMEDVVPENHYEMQTLLSGKEINVVLDVMADGQVTGKYCFSNNGNPTSAWYKLKGNVLEEKGSGKLLALDVFNPNEITSQQWRVTLSGNNKYASLTGEVVDYTAEIRSFVGSSKPTESLYESYNLYMDEDEDDYDNSVGDGDYYY